MLSTTDAAPIESHGTEVSDEVAEESPDSRGPPPRIGPYPKSQLLILAFCRLSEPITMTSSFPYLFFMIRDFHITDSQKDISRYAGILASCFSFAQVLSCTNTPSKRTIPKTY